MMTGITRVRKESVFSDLNNLKVITITSKKYEAFFCFTEKEVFTALDEYGVQDKMHDVKRWYDGFRFGECDNIYNPWSVINFLDDSIWSLLLAGGYLKVVKASLNPGGKFNCELKLTNLEVKTAF